MKRLTNEGGGSPSSKLARVAVMVSQQQTSQTQTQQQLQQQPLNNQPQQQQQHHRNNYHYDDERVDEQLTRQHQGRGGQNNNDSNSTTGRLQQKKLEQRNGDNDRPQLEQDGSSVLNDASKLKEQVARVRRKQQRSQPNHHDHKQTVLQTDQEQGGKFRLESPKTGNALKHRLEQQQQQVQGQSRAQQRNRSSTSQDHKDQKLNSPQGIREKTIQSRNKQYQHQSNQHNIHVASVHKAHNDDCHEQKRQHIRKESSVKHAESNRFAAASKTAKTVTNCAVLKLPADRTSTQISSRIAAATASAHRKTSMMLQANCSAVKTTILSAGEGDDVDAENGRNCSADSSSRGSTPMATSEVILQSGLQPRQTAQGGQQTVSTPGSTASTAEGSTDRSGTSREKAIRMLRKNACDDWEQRLGEGDGGNRKTDGLSTASVLYRDRLTLLPINCQEKLVFIVDSSTETGQPCGQFVDGSPACILDALKKAIRLLALRRTGMNPSAQVGLVEWGRTPRWKFFPRSISSDHASLDAIFDKLHPATANEELCDFNYVLQSIKERTGLSMMWNKTCPSFVVRAIVFYCRSTPPSWSVSETSTSHRSTVVENTSHSGPLMTSDSGDRVQRLVDLKYHPLFTLDAVFMLPKASCLKHEPQIVSVEDHSERARTAQALEKGDQIIHGDGTPMQDCEVEQAQEVVGDTEQKKAEVPEVQALEQDQPPQKQDQPSDDVAVEEDQAAENNKKNLRIEAVQQAQGVFDWVHSLCTPSSYILPCAPSPLQILQQCCRLLGHPLQRPPQHLAHHHLRPVQTSNQSEKPESASQQHHTPLPSRHSQMIGGDRDSSTESSSTLSRPDDESMLVDLT